MSVRVVELFEMIDVDHQQRHRLLLAQASRELAGERVVEAPAIGQLGEAIDHRDALEVVLHREDPDPGLQPRPQFLGIGRLDDVIVGAGVEPGDDVAPCLARRDQNQIHRHAGSMRAGTPADFGTIEPRHHPVEDRQAGSVG